MHAPAVVSSGTNRFAQRLKRLAMIYGIPVVEDRLLARALFKETALNAAVPEEFFTWPETVMPFDAATRGANT